MHVTAGRLNQLVDQCGADPSDVRCMHRTHTGVEQVGVLDLAEQGIGKEGFVGGPHVLAVVVEAEEEVKHSLLGVCETGE